jgi:DNA-directed RNA polymerase specialized sigma subunit
MSRTTQKEVANVELVLLARAGDPHAFEQLWKNCQPFLRGPMNGFLAYLPYTWAGRRRVERNDVQQEGLAGMWTAIRDFDPQRGKALVHLSFRARSAMQAYLRRQVTLRRLHAEDPANARSANDVFVGDMPVVYADSTEAAP